MVTLKKTLVVVLTCVVLSPTFASDKDKSETQQRFQRLLVIIQDALQGKNLDLLRKNITNDAHIVDGAFFSSLHEVLSDEKFSLRLNEGAERRLGFMQANIQDDGSGGYMVLKTESSEKTEPRFHTVNFVKAKDGEFRIKDWHASR